MNLAGGHQSKIYTREHVDETRANTSGLNVQPNNQNSIQLKEVSMWSQYFLFDFYIAAETGVVVYIDSRVPTKLLLTNAYFTCTGMK